MGNRSIWGIWMDIFMSFCSMCPLTAVLTVQQKQLGVSRFIQQQVPTLVSSSHQPCSSESSTRRVCLCNITWTGVEVKTHDWRVKIWWNVKSHSTLRLLLLAPESSSLKNHNLLCINETRCRTAEWSQFHENQVCMCTHEVLSACLQPVLHLCMWVLTGGHWNCFHIYDWPHLDYDIECLPVLHGAVRPGTR